VLEQICFSTASTGCNECCPETECLNNGHPAAHALPGRAGLCMGRSGQACGIEIMFLFKLPLFDLPDDHRYTIHAENLAAGFLFF
jgi:hypothetical protein